MEDMIPAPLSRARLALWLITPALTGAVIMALELAAFRLYAPYFGYSIYVWGSMISVVMLALACGYGAGGWLADRCKTDTPLYVTILLSGLYQFVIVCIARSLLTKLAEMGDSAGTGLATLIIFAPPMIALASVGPFTIRLLARANQVGATAGTVYALSTIGSVAGVLGTTFFLIPEFGTQATLLTVCALSVLIGAAGLLGMKRMAFLALLPVALYPLSPQPLWYEGALWTKESAYNLVRVIRDRQRLALTLNDESSMHTVLDKTNRWTGHYYDYFALGPLLVDADNALVLGMGAGASIATIRATAPDVQIDAVEIDETVVEAGVRFFDIPKDSPWLRIYVADARPWLARSTKAYNVIQLDMYQGGPYIPFYLATVEFFRLTRAHLSEDGLLMMNLFDGGSSRELLSAMVATLKQAFPTVMVLPIRQTNYMLFAFAQERAVVSIRNRLNSIERDATIKGLAQYAAKNIFEMNVPAGTGVLTDDHAPVEEMTRRMTSSMRRAR